MSQSLTLEWGTANSRTFATVRDAYDFTQAEEHSLTAFRICQKTSRTAWAEFKRLWTATGDRNEF